MKQGNSAGSMIDLDDLERQLNSAVSAKKTLGDDPLSELARIVGRDEPRTGNLISSKSLGFAPANDVGQRIAPSFDDFLKVPPRPASGIMPSRTPPVEPLFPDISVHASDAIAPADMLQDEEFGDLEPQEANSDVLFHDEDELLDESGRIPAVAAQAETPAQVIAAGDNAPTTKNNFDDMLAEFEAAMKDVGAEKSTPASVPSLAPIVIPPPPESMTELQTSPSNVQPSFGLGTAALGLGAAAAGASLVSSAKAPVVADASNQTTKGLRGNRGLTIAAGVIGIAVIGVSALFFSGGAAKQATGKDAPTIAAKPGVVKERPVNPGGVEVANQDKEVLQSKVAEVKAPERVAPREEQPVDLTQAQRAAQTQPLVRQIPGIGIIAPISTTPPSPSSAPSPAPGASPSVAGGQPVPRPVASVPIGISGQPAPAVSPPVAAVVAPTPAPAANSAPPAISPPATPTPATAQPSTPAEPRRVRAVPIRTETTDAAPTRAQAQPRIVQANPRKLTAEEPDDTNAPLRITPQANRVPTRVATAQPATTQTTAPQPAPAVSPANAGSGFTVQLAAEGSEEAARAKFNRVKGQYSDVLGGYSPNIRSADVNGKSVYRVRVGSLSREEAVGLCERLKASGGNCFVARN